MHRNRTSLLALALVATSLPSLAQTGSQATELVATFRNGQTFLVFKEAAKATTPPEAYRVYRSATAIAKTADLASATLLATVPKDSRLNSRGKAIYRLENGKPELAPGEGFLVTTPAVAGKSWYVVTAVTKGVENKGIVTGGGGNAVGPVVESLASTEPVLQRTALAGLESYYVHFSPAVTRGTSPALSNREGRSFNYRVYVDRQRTGPRPVYFFLHFRVGDFTSLPIADWLPKNAIQVFVDDESDPLPSSLWFGSHEGFPTGPARGKVVDYTERRILWTLDKVLEDSTLGADAQRVYAYGVSFGALGALGLGIRHSDVFAAVAGLLPAMGIVHDDFSFKKEVAELFGTRQQNLPSTVGPRIYDAFDYKAELTRREAAGVAPMLFVVGRSDLTVGWEDKPPFFRATQATRQPGTYYWDPRRHDLFGAWSPLQTILVAEMGEIRLDRPLPVFSNLSIDEDPGNGNRFSGDAIGTMGGYATFDPATASETASDVIVDVGLKSDPTRLDQARVPTAKVDLTLRRLSKFKVTPGGYYSFVATRVGQTAVEEESTVVADGSGLLTARSFELARDMRRVKVTPLTGAVPEVRWGGTLRRGDTVRLYVLGPKGAMCFLGSGSSLSETKIQTSLGIWRVSPDSGILLWQAPIPASGLVELEFPLPNMPVLKGLGMIAQALVGQTITALVKTTIR